MLSRKDWDLGENVKIGNNVRINVSERLVIGDRSVIRDNVIIEGRSVEIGTESWIDEYAHIGGGSCFDHQSELVAGDWLHMGKFSHVNTARRVKIGDEVGVGINTKIFSHGAYLSAWSGFPVQFEGVEIGNNVWLPNAWVNPGVRIGDNVVVAAMSLVNHDIPSGCLAGGIPAKVIKSDVYPVELGFDAKFKILNSIEKDTRLRFKFADGVIMYGNTSFDLGTLTIHGPADVKTELLRNQLRRYGIRFRFKQQDGVYVKW